MLKKRILIYRIGAIGDVVHTLPFIKLLRVREPQASIEYIVGSPPLVELLQSCTDYIDKVWLVNKKTLAKDLKALASVSPIDEFIFLHSGWWKAYWLNFVAVKAKQVYVYKRDDSLTAVANYVITYCPEMKLDLAGNALAQLEWQTLFAPISKNNVPGSKSRVFELLGLEPGQTYISIVPGVGHLRPHRAYPLERWLEFIEKHKDKNIILLGGPDEAELSEQINTWLASRPSLKVQNLIGKTSLVDLVTILSQAEHLYSADTGILHIGAAAGVALTALFSITSPKRFGPFSPKAKILQAPNCSCNASTTNRPKHCLSAQLNYASCMQGIDLV